MARQRNISGRPVRRGSIRRGPIRRAGLALLALLLAPMLVIIAPGTAMACSCAVADTETLVSYVDTVAAGELTEIEPPPQPSDGTVDSADRLTYTATVHTVFKGEVEAELVFHTDFGSSCALADMAVGRDYVFFVRDGGSGLCDGTARSSPRLIAEVEAVTGPGQEPAAPSADPPPIAATATDQPSTTDSEQSTLPAVLPWSALVAGVLAVALGWLLWTRRSRTH